MDSTNALITSLQNENVKLTQTIQELQIQLEKYTNNNRHKKYYEKNKERIKQNSKEYLTKLKEENPEKLKEYRHSAYLHRKEKAQNINNDA
jgi:hypothetical protein